MQRVKRLFGAAKAGHTGALDPLATGMLPVCLGEATKFSQYLLDTDKTYQVTAKLGVRTTTSDAAGDVVESKPVNVSAEQFAAACEAFRGPIKQVPSMFSALKYQGKPLYTYARQGIEIPREVRDITIYRLTIERFDADEVDMTVHCSKGTYIRSLVDDIGQALGCGAYVSKLHRSQVTNYPSDKMLTLEQLEAEVTVAEQQAISVWQHLDSLLLPMDTAVSKLPQVSISAEQAVYFNNGNSARIIADSLSRSVSEGEQIRVYSQDGQLFLGVAEFESSQLVQPRRVVVQNID